MKKFMIAIAEEDGFVDNKPVDTLVLLRFRSWRIRDLLEGIVAHITHAATRDKTFLYLMPAEIIKIPDRCCPRCGSKHIVPVVYGYCAVEEEDNELAKLEKAGLIECPGCDATDGYNLACQRCRHMWTEKYGYDWGICSQQERD